MSDDEIEAAPTGVAFVIFAVVALLIGFAVSRMVQHG